MTKLCPKCGTEFADPVDLTALEHWLNEHQNDETLIDILSSTWVQVDCHDCGQAFFSPVSYGGGGRIGADAYCPDCDDEGVRQIIVQSLTPAQVLEREVDPSDDDLDNRRVFVTENDTEPAENVNGGGE